MHIRTRVHLVPIAVPLLVVLSLALSSCKAPDSGTPGPAPSTGSPTVTTAPAPTAPTASPAPSATPPASAAPTASATAGAPAPDSRSAALPFDLPPAETLRSSKKLVFAHYFTPYPISLDNLPAESDYYARNYLSPDGEGGAFKAVGGLLRQRPLPRAPLSGDYALEDLKTEVQRAVAAGIDGFAVDLLEYSGRNWVATQNLIKAAEQVDPGFKIMLEPDMTSLPSDPAALTTAIASLASSPSVFRLSDGRLVVAPFAAEQEPVTWWSQWLGSMAASGTRIAFVPVFVNYSSAASFEPISYGLSTWGMRSPTPNKHVDPTSALAHAKGKVWMQPVSAQDERPRSGVYTEAGNTENLRATWENAITNGADWVQIPTWNDYSEGTEISPSTHTGYVFLDLCSYYLTWFKTGSAPAITRDVAYLTNRVQFAAMRPTQQETVMTLMAGSDPPRDVVEVVSFLTAPASVTASVGGQGQTYTAPAGVSAKLFPLAAGTTGVSLARGSSSLGSVTSPYPVMSSAPTQDLQYYGVSTSRTP